LDKEGTIKEQRRNDEVLPVPKTQDKSGRMLVKPAILTLTLNGDNDGELRNDVG
jgi:hypothetical protein